MKKLFAFLLACVCTLALFGCAGANDDKSDGGPEDDWAPLTETQIEEFKELFASTADVTDETTGTVMASSGSGGSGSGVSGSGGASGSSLSGTKISVKNGNGTQGCASDAAAKLTPQGAVCETGNADDSNYAKTLVIYDGNNADKAQKVADLLGCGTVMKNDGRYTYTGDILVVVGQDWK